MRYKLKSIPEVIFNSPPHHLGASLLAQLVKICLQCGRPGSILGSGRSPGEGKGYPLQYSGLENSVDCSSCSCKESDMTEHLSHHTILDLKKKRRVCNIIV